ncbi:acyltransferase family protein [Phycicoccus sonneratiae]|uniref:Acyltransferase family protein n=1 Tax=Phycicoccus sonneratiae TaxID=2807628 RepID=A0ABS2CPE4_9MICO|nr:acyltransferase family protein [Phycicoccus sonneraticus]MBM6401763.1 acyltransferase family protein [Phycicoccus sonneraticus]
METLSPAAVAAATPATRNRVVDLLRVGALTVVVLGHWLVAAVVVRDGRLDAGAVLDRASWTHPLTWVFQVMPVFFLVGGYANAVSWRGARERGVAWPEWLRGRLRRLLVPVVPLLLFWVGLLVVADAAGVDRASLRTASQVALVPTWFLAAYVVVCALAPLTLRLWERFGWASVVGGLAVGGVVDLVSLTVGPWWVGFANYVVVWGAVHQLGYAWLDGRVGGTGRRLAMAAVGLVGLVALVRAGPYPVSMIGLDGAAVNNSYPTRVTLGFLGLLQGGVVLALEPALRRAMSRPRAWTTVVVLGRRMMSVYLWHLTVMVLAIGGSLLVGGFGLGAEPLSGAWWTTRPVWWLVLGTLTAGVVALVGRFEDVRRTAGRVAAWRPVAAAVLGCGGLGVMAARGLVGREGLSWWWAILPVLGVALVSPGPRRPRG